MWGWEGGHTRFHPKAALGLHLPAQLPTPRSPLGAYALTQVHTHGLTKAAAGCWSLSSRKAGGDPNRRSDRGDAPSGPSDGMGKGKMGVHMRIRLPSGPSAGAPLSALLGECALRYS